MGHPRPVGSSLILASLLVAGSVLPLNAITQLDFFQSYGKGEILRQGDSEYEMIKLEPPMPFFSQNFDHIYVRTIFVGGFRVMVIISSDLCAK